MGKKVPSANKIAKDIRGIIDAYWASQISEEEARKKINLFLENPEIRIKIMRRENYTGTFKSIMRENRLQAFTELTTR